MWPVDAEALIELQEQLAEATPPPWLPSGDFVVGGCFACFAGDRAWVGAAVGEQTAVAAGAVTAPYVPGLLALREGPLLEAAVRSLPERPDVLLVNATGRDHPRRAGLALHLGAVLDLPTVGVTHRPLCSPGEVRWVTTRRGTRPLAVHPAWRTDAETAVTVVQAATRGARTPEPLRTARRAAREARARTRP